MSQVDAPKEEKKETEKGRENTSFRSAPIRNHEADLNKRNSTHLDSKLDFPKRLKYAPDFVNAFHDTICDTVRNACMPVSDEPGASH